MHEMHLGSLDLNLLRVFDALLLERNVTKAGARLGLTQSAVSHALNRLRYTLGDPLFIRCPSGMQPTVRALEIWPAIHASLLQIQAALAPADFDPARTARAFTVVAGPYACAILLPAVVERLREDAPSGGYEDAPERYAYEPLVGDTLVWVVRNGHPASGGPLGLEELAAIPHVIISTAGESGEAEGAVVEQGLRRRSSWEDAGAFERSLAERGLKRKVGVIAPDTFSALAIAMRTDMAAQLPLRLAGISLKAQRVALLETDYVAPRVEIGLLHRRDRATDPAQAWFLGVLRDAARGLLE